jgi:hypothetical protein
LYAVLKLLFNQNSIPPNFEPTKLQLEPLIIMVQISNTLIIAAAVAVPVLSAPLGMDSNPLEWVFQVVQRNFQLTDNYLRAREPKGFRTAGRIASKFASGVSLGAK